MAARVVTVAFQRLEARRVGVEVQFTRREAKVFLVGMGDKAAEPGTRARRIFRSGAVAAEPPDHRQPGARRPSQEAGDDRRALQAARAADGIADLEGCDSVRRVHIAEGLIYRRVSPGSVPGSPSAMAG